MLMNERLKAARKEANFTQAMVAGILGIDRSTYAYYELGDTNPSIENLMKLAAMFRVDMGWLLGTDRPKNVFCAPEGKGELRRQVLQQKISELSDDEKEIIALYRIAKQCSRNEELSELLKKMSEEIL